MGVCESATGYAVGNAFAGKILSDMVIAPAVVPALTSIGSFAAGVGVGCAVVAVGNYVYSQIYSEAKQS